MSITYLVPDDPWVTSGYARCEGCGNSALRETPHDDAPPVGTQYLCSRCVRRGVLPDLAEFEDEQLAALVADLTGRQPAPDSYYSRVLAAAQQEIADRAAEQAKYEVVASFDAPTKDDETVWSCQVQRRGTIHFEMQFPPDDGRRPLALAALSATDAEAIGRGLLEAAKRARHQERHANRS